MQKEAVKRALGFAPQFDFYAEVTVETPNGFVTAREGSYTENGALTRAQMTARERTMFAGMKRAAGFVADALIPDVKPAAKTTIGFA
jgi:hypothetical protein